MALSRKIFRLALLPALLAAASVDAVTVTDLYETAQPVQGSQDAAFVEALKTVIVRVSGQRDAPERLGEQINDPRKYVQRYGITADGVLEVGFDSISVDRLLSSSGLPIWGRERPATLVMLKMEEVDGLAHWIDAGVPSLERELLAKEARFRGLPLKWPTLDLIQMNSQLGGDSAPASADLLLQIAERNGANAVLVGQARGGAVRWTLISSEGNAQTSGTLLDGVHLAADVFARVYATSGSSLDSVTLEVSGITDLDAYAATLNYLEGMTLVRGVALEQVMGDTMQLRLAVRGDATTLQRAIALDDKLVPLDHAMSDPATGAGERLVFRYQP